MVMEICIAIYCCVTHLTCKWMTTLAEQDIFVSISVPAFYLTDVQYMKYVRLCCFCFKTTLVGLHGMFLCQLQQDEMYRRMLSM